MLMPKLFKTYRLLTITIFLFGFIAVGTIYYYRDFIFKQVSNVFLKQDYSHAYLKPVDYKIQSQWLKNVPYLRNEKLLIPENWEAVIFASGLNNPSKIQVLSSTQVLVTELNPGNVTILIDSDYDNSANSATVFDSGLSLPNGIYFYDNNLYVATNNAVYIYKNINEQLNAFQPEKEKLIDLPLGGLNNLKNIFVNNNGIYVSVGSSCDYCVEPDKKRGSLLKYNLNGGEEEIYASGFRRINSIIGIGPSLVVSDDNTTKSAYNFDDEINIIQFGGFYGWPYFAGKNVSTNINIGVNNELINKKILPEFDFNYGSIPNGMEYVDQDNSGALFVNLTGQQKTIKIAFFEQQPSIDDFLVFKNTDNSVKPLLSDIKRFKDGFLISDSGRGVIYFVYPR